jgi:Ethanolamine utilization protein EutJ (predicted chaperonin)
VIIDLDQQITDAYAEGTAAVQPEHHHIFKLALPQRLKIHKQKWMAFFELAQAKARAHKQR